MVGDGANDCGALKAAHTGISLSDTESSVASPFTSRETNISCVTDVIREGRAALVTSFGLFKYMTAYSLTQFISVIILYSNKSNLTDFEFLYIDLFIISTFAFFFSRTRTYDGPLAKSPPPSSLVGIVPLFCIVLQMTVIFSIQYGSLFHARHSPWFTPSNHTSDSDEVDGCYENYTIFIVSCFQYIILAIVFSKGRPYRKSILTNHGLLLTAIILTSFSAYLAIGPFEFLRVKLKLVLPDESKGGMDFRYMLIGYGLINFATAMFVEYFVIDFLVQKKIMPKINKKSKQEYLRIERDIRRDCSWPPLTPEPLPEASSGIVINKPNVKEIKKCSNELYESVEGMSSSDWSSSRYESFSSAREVPLNPR